MEAGKDAFEDCTCMWGVCVRARTCTHPKRLEEGFRSLGSGLTGGPEPPSVGTRNCALEEQPPASGISSLLLWAAVGSFRSKWWREECIEKVFMLNFLVSITSIINYVLLFLKHGEFWEAGRGRFSPCVAYDGDIIYSSCFGGHCHLSCFGETLFTLLCAFF